MIYGANAQEFEYRDKSFKNGTIINCELLKEQEFLEYNIKVGLLSVGEINFRKSNCKDSKLIYAEIKGYTKGIGKLFFNLINTIFYHGIKKILLIIFNKFSNLKSVTYHTRHLSWRC